MRKFIVGGASLAFISGCLFLFNQLVNTSNAQISATEPDAITLAKSVEQRSTDTNTNTNINTKTSVETNLAPSDATSVIKLPDYLLWAEVLAMFVNEEGLVDYEGLLKDREKFDTFIEQIENASLTGMSHEEQKAFWINAYNAITIKVILDKYPVKSIRRINFGLVWEIGRRVAGEDKSLGDIEHKILRPLGDPRIHFAINCASIGCPKLSRTPFYPNTLDEQLEAEAKRFINDSDRIRLDRSKNVLYHSAILKWFKEDFLEVAPSLTEYVKKYINDQDRAFLEDNKVKEKVLKYDWSLNKQ